MLSIVKPCESKRYNIRCAIKKLKNNFTKEKLYLIIFFPIFHFDPLESMRKPFDILCFEENQKGTTKQNDGLPRPMLNILDYLKFIR